MSFLNQIEQRRTIYSIGNNVSLSQDETMTAKAKVLIVNTFFITFKL